MRGWRNIDAALEHLFGEAAEHVTPDLGIGEAVDRSTWGNLDADLLEELYEERLFDRLLEEDCKCRH